MIVADAWIKPWLGHHLSWMRWVLPAVCAVGVIAAGKLLARLQSQARREPEKKDPASVPHP